MNKCNDMTQYDNLNEYSKNEQKNFGKEQR